MLIQSGKLRIISRLLWVTCAWQSAGFTLRGGSLNNRATVGAWRRWSSGMKPAIRMRPVRGDGRGGGKTWIIIRETWVCRVSKDTFTTGIPLPICTHDKPPLKLSHRWVGVSIKYTHVFFSQLWLVYSEVACFPVPPHRLPAHLASVVLTRRNHPAQGCIIVHLRGC